jgi:putative restriction endonuclease
VLVGVEAAHIKWHQAGGPDTNPNGIALCSLHHKLFDRGMITITDDYRVVVSEYATGSAVFQHMVTSFHGTQLALPIRTNYYPDHEFIDWHVREVFRFPGRELESNSIR